MSTLYYYLKAVLAGLSSGVVYASAVLGANFDWSAIQHLSVGNWVGLLLAVLGVGGVTAVATNGPAPVKKDAAAPVA